jgi:putative endonuclease
MTGPALGVTGEQDARTYLEAQGMTFVASNWHCRAGELDLVMLDGDELAVIEVKARRGERSGRAEESVSPAKARKLLAAAEWFVSAHDAHHHRIWRIDLLALTYDRTGRIERIAHIPNAIVTG